MALTESSKVGKRGTFVIPARLRRIFGFQEGSEIIAEETPDGILLRPAMTVPIELYSPQRKAEFILGNAVDAEDYRQALEEVRKLGVDPSSKPHQPPDEG
jgi:AbrB family looped-hinge helix DNA binding protein